MGVYVVNTVASGSNAPTSKTKNSVVNNTISNSQVRGTTRATSWLETATEVGIVVTTSNR